MEDRKRNIIFIVLLLLVFLGVWGRHYIINAPGPVENIEIEIIDAETKDIILDNKTVMINDGGVYTLSGTIDNGGVVVSTKDEIKLILNGVKVTNSSGPAIVFEKNGKATIELAKGTTNTLIDGKSYNSEKYDGCIHVTGDLVMTGSGGLEVKANYKNAITSDGNITFDGGVYNITAVNDGIHAHKDLYINNGVYDINGKEDALHADRMVIYEGGVANIAAAEGIEATVVKIEGGVINIAATDDGINASQKADIGTPAIEINGGVIVIDMAMGDTDGLDSNGNLFINGGMLTINAVSPFDYDGMALYTGGTMIINGKVTTAITNQFADRPNKTM